MSIESKRATIVRLAAAAGLGHFLPAEQGLPATWWGVDLDALEYFFDCAAKEIVLMREIELMSQKVDVVAAVAAWREACAQVAEDGDHEVEGRGYYMQGGDARATMRNIAAAIRARGAA